MKTIKLLEIAHARSGDKGDGSNVGLIAYTDHGYEVIRREVTAERVRAHFAQICMGRVDRYEIPNLKALNFILHDSLGGGGTESVKTDAQGKTFAQAILAQKAPIPQDVLSEVANTAN